MGQEIEKKFLVDGNLPEDAQILKVKGIEQTYLAVGDEEVRVRSIIADDKETFTMTIKKGKGLAREEIEFGISQATYQQLLSGGDKKPLRKTRRQVVVDNQTFDFDIYHHPNLPELKTIEIEFDTVEEALNFKKPDWFGEDVTENKSYKNQSLWKKVQ